MREIKLVFYFLLFTIHCAEGLEISPSAEVMWLREKESLVISCLIKGNYTPVKWTKDGKDLLDDDFTIQVSRRTHDNGGYLYDVTARKEITSFSEKGNYKCETDSEQNTIFVHVFKIDVKHGTYSTTRPMSLQCQPVFSTHSPNSYIVEWSRDSIDLKTDWPSKYVEHEGGTILEILDADVGDMGEYKCTVTLNRGTTHPQRFVEMINVYSKPLHQNISEMSVTTVSIGQTLELSCEAYGHPQPEVTWFKNSFSSIPITEGDKHVVTSHGKLIVLSTNTADRGTYYCISENSLGYFKRIFNVNVL